MDWFTPAFALLQEGEGGSPGGGILELAIPFVLLIVVFWFLIIRPQQKQQKQKQEMLNNVKKKDRIVTSGGIRGVVERIRDNDITLIIDEKKEVRMRIVKSAIAMVEKPEHEADKNKEEKAEKDKGKE